MAQLAYRKICVLSYKVCKVSFCEPPKIFSLKSVWILGYSNFNNLDMQTLWWLPNKILRHIHKKRFSVFLSRFLRICNQSLQKVPKRATTTKNFIKKFNMGIKIRRISRWFWIRWKSFEKMHHKNVISKNVMEKARFSLFTHVRQSIFAYNFFLVHFLQLFQWIWNQHEILRFLISFLIFFAKKNCAVFLALFANFEAERAKNGSKNRKMYLVNVS